MIDTREELVVALNEASEIEHGLMVQYLFAALSCKKSTSEGLTPEQEALVREWQGTILRVAVEEMGHLGTVCNLLSAIGSPPHFRRPNFPQATGYYPFAFDLLPLSDKMMYRFQVFELPRGFPPPPPPVESFVPAATALLREVIPDPLEYTYVGELYAKIREGFENIPADKLFIGPLGGQTEDDWSVDLDIRKVVDRNSAIAAINDIIEDGEGTPNDLGNSHYARFTAIREQYAAAGRFSASRDVAANPSIREQRDSQGAVSPILNRETRRVAELFAGVYALALRMLMQYFSFGGESATQREVLRASAARLMSVAIRPIAEVLTLLPIDQPDGLRAGPTFELFNDVVVPMHKPARWVMLLEQFDAVIVEAASLGATVPRIAHVGETLQFMRRALATSAREV